MKIQPVSHPSQIQPTAPTSNASAARDRAISALVGNQAQAPAQAQEHPVLNPSQISPEEALLVTGTSGQTDKDVDTAQSEDTVTEEQAAKVEEPKKVDPTLSQQFAKLARQEKAARQRQQQADQALRQREEAIKAREVAIAAKDQEFSPDRYVSKERLKAEALQVLAEAGIPYDEIVQQAINQTPIDPRTQAEIRALKAELQAIKDDAKKGLQTQQEQQQEQYRTAVKQIETDVRNLVKADPNFETVRVTNSVQDVVELIEKTFQKDGVLLSVEDATQMVEDYLLEEAIKLTKIEKIKKRIAANSGTSQQVAKAQSAPPQTKQQQPMKTLTNATSSTRKLSARERAMLAFKGELK